MFAIRYSIPSSPDRLLIRVHVHASARPSDLGSGITWPPLSRTTASIVGQHMLIPSARSSGGRR
jgi:hypothetical protein